MLGGPAIPVVPLRFYAYVVVDKGVVPPAPVAVELTRAAARDYVNGLAEPPRYRIRRAKVTTFES